MSKDKEKKGIIRRILKFVSIFFGVIIVLIVGVSIAAMMIITKPFIEGIMEGQLHRQVRIGDLSGGLFSAISGFTVKDVKISNYKTEEEIESLKEKPIADNDIFASMKALNFKISIPPLLSKKFVLNELMLLSPQVNIVRYKSGAFNFSDLLVPKPKTAEEKAAQEKKMREEAEKPKEKSEPLKADDLPVAINVGSVGMEDGNVNFTDMGTGQKLNLYKVTAKVFNIKIDPQDIEKTNSMSLKIFAGIKTLSSPESGSVQSFDIGFDVAGNIIPFDKKTRILDPEVSVKAGSPYGNITGLQIFNEMINVETLAKYSGKFDFLKKEIDWKNGYVNIHYKANVVTISNGKISTDDYGLTFGGSVNIASMGLNLNSDMTLANKHTEKVKGQISKLAEKAIPSNAKNYIKPDTIANTAIKPMVNDKGELFLQYTVKGTASKPSVNLIHPKIGSLSDIIKDALKDVGANVADAAKEKAQQKVADKVSEKADKGKEKAKGKVKGLFK
ncbi:MAG: AsmA family protein [Spirochaetes bacterium]|nr:AsmA family protein [Spirochaetota bacterium]